MERPSLGRVIFGAALVLVTVLTLLSLLSHSGNQYPSEESYPRSSAQDNWCGVVGAWISSGIIGALGGPAAYLLIFLGILWIVLAFTGREIHTPALRITGIVLALITTSTIFAGTTGTTTARPDGPATPATWAISSRRSSCGTSRGSARCCCC